MPDADEAVSARVALARLDQFDRGLDRLEDDMDKLDQKFDTLTARLDGIGNRVTALETWKADTGAVQESKHWLIGVIVAGAALVVAIVTSVVH